MEGLLILTVLTMFVLSDARPSFVTPIPIEPEKIAENHVRIRRQNFDYGHYMANYWRKISSCTDCHTLNAGNGYKNTNRFYFGNGEQLGNYDTLIIGNGAKNANTMFFGAKPRFGDKDPFELPFFKN